MALLVILTDGSNGARTAHGGPVESTKPLMKTGTEQGAQSYVAVYVRATYVTEGAAIRQRSGLAPKRVESLD